MRAGEADRGIATGRPPAMSRTILTEPITKRAFESYGDVLELRATPDVMINQGLVTLDKVRVVINRDDEE